MRKFKLKFILAVTCITLLTLLHVNAIDPIEAPGGLVTAPDEFVTALGGDAAAYHDENIIILKSDILLKSPITITAGTYIIQGSGCYIYCGENLTAIFHLNGEDVNLVLGNNRGSDDHPSLTLTGNGYTGSGLYVENGNAEIYKGTLLTGLSAPKGGGINIGNGDLTIYGGVISDCQASESGGAVHLDSGNILVYQASFINCVSENNGGAVAVCGGNMETALLTYTDNSAVNGGAVYLANGEYYMNSSSIDTNYAVNGGGVYVADGGKFHMTGGYFARNEADFGGAVFVDVNGEAYFNNADSSVTLNKAESGGAVYNAGTVTVDNISINYNTSSKSGGGIYNKNLLIMNGGTISTNDSGGNAGGIYNEGRMEISNGSISSNKAERSAQGIENNGELIISDNCFISFNNDVLLGGTENVKVEILSELTANSPVATFTPPQYKKGLQIVTGVTFEKLAVSDNGDNGTWYIDENGALQFKKDPLDTKYIIIIAVASVVIITVTVILILNIKNKKRMD